VDALKKAMSDPAIQKEIANNRKLTQALSFTGTPAFVIGDQLVPGAVDLKTLKQLVEMARKRS
jgi:protein-disulfide isomerase